MGLNILCSGYLVRQPVGGQSWHHLQYLVGLQRLGHDVTFFEHYGWASSCFDPVQDVKTADPTYGIAYLRRLLRPHGLDGRWCYLAEDGHAYGMTRERLQQVCRDCDLYLNLSNINWIDDLMDCRRRVLIDTDPVLTQTGAFGLGGPFSRYDALFTYGENVHKPGCDMPTGGAIWWPTRQPVVLDLWPVEPPLRGRPFTTVMSWKSYRDVEYEGRVFGQKDRQFEEYYSLPAQLGEHMQLAVRAPAPAAERLKAGGWRLVNPLEVTRSPSSYQRYIQSSRAEFSVAAHAYVSTRCGWFSDRTTAYLASGRPAVIQDTGFSDWLPSGSGVVPFVTRDDAIDAIADVNGRYELHCREARRVAEDHFDARQVLSGLIDRAMRSDH
jgi:hypothetical protein